MYDVNYGRGNARSFDPIVNSPPRLRDSKFTGTLETSTVTVLRNAPRYPCVPVTLNITRKYALSVSAEVSVCY